MSDPKNRKGRKDKKTDVPLPYEVDMTATAEEVYKDFYHKAKSAEQKGDYSNSHITTFRAIREAVREIIPRDPLNKNYALRGELSVPDEYFKEFRKAGVRLGHA